MNAMQMQWEFGGLANSTSPAMSSYPLGIHEKSLVRSLGLVLLGQYCL